MKIIAHRGLWNERKEGNTLESFKKAFEYGYGIETDVRDHHGKLVVSHDVAADPALEFEEVLKLYVGMDCRSEIAVNIKADGLQQFLKDVLKQYHIQNYFVFDMSVPEQVVYHQQDFRVFTRMSEWETIPVLIDKAQGIWMDEWENAWIQPDIIRKYRNMDKQISIISPEIHGRDAAPLWKELRQFTDDEAVILCTDIPLKAEEYFNG